MLKELRDWQLPTLLAVAGCVLLFLSFFRISDLSHAAFEAYHEPLSGPLFADSGLLLAVILLHLRASRRTTEQEPQTKDKPVSVPQAVLTLVPENTPISTPYGTILHDHHTRLAEGLRRLARAEDWPTLLALRSRMREYFEWSGQYREGARHGRNYVRALEAVGAQEEALWAQVKEVGWMEILGGQHESGREEIAVASTRIAALTRSAPSLKRLVFYCHRYTGVSFQRQEPPDLEEAEAAFSRAEASIGALTGDTRELVARIVRNKGNVALDRGEISPATALFRKSLDGFIDLRDEEHQAITRIQLAQALLATPGAMAGARSELMAARRIAIRIGWQEGIARTSYFLGEVHENLGDVAANLEDRRRELEEAKEEYMDCEKVCSQIDDYLWKGRAQEALKRVRRSLF